MDAWIWLVLALVFTAVETQLLGTFVCIFFALAAGLVSASVAIGLTPLLWQQSLAFGGTATASMLLFRRRLRRARAGPRGAHAGQDIDSLVGAEATVLQALLPGAIGQVELRGVPWRAQSLADSPLPAGGRCWVQELDGLTLQVVGLRGGTSEPREDGPAGGQTAGNKAHSGES